MVTARTTRLMRLVAMLCAISLLGSAQTAVGFELMGLPAVEEPAYSLYPHRSLQEERRYSSSPLDENSWTGYRLLTAGASDIATLGDFAQADPGQPAPLGRDWPGLWADTGLFVGYLLAVSGVLYLLPEEATGWNDKEKQDLLDTWWENVTNPHMDPDAWWVNYITHPYWGAAYYIRARERGFGPFGSFVYSTTLSTIFELGEAFYEQLSYQDLIVTPVIGSLTGAFLFEPARNWVKAKPQWKWYDHTIMVATDPLGGLNAVVEWLFGIKSEVRMQFRPLAEPSRDRPAPTGFSRGQEGGVRRADGFGIGLTFRY
jgi:hypothetical protein